MFLTQNALHAGAFLQTKEPRQHAVQFRLDCQTIVLSAGLLHQSVPTSSRHHWLRVDKRLPDKEGTLYRFSQFEKRKSARMPNEDQHS